MAGDESKEPDSRRRVPADDVAQQPTETTAPDTPVGIPRQIGGFRVKRVIASGGMGTVYEALQERPRRTVALKVMKHGIASRSALRRFEYESQILARLRHPGIAQVYEAGTHEEPGGAVPYFAMEYIPNGRPLTGYAYDRRITTRERLELFAQVCDAVHHGHQKGIIHRDLKPSNILVDSQGQVKIIDFGLARATDSDLAVTTLQTEVGQLVGTLQYMSPEQCVADPHDIDIRSDVYALGVVLYELLSGQLPYDVREKPLLETTRLIREQQPVRLSTANAAMKGEMETIVTKALEKDRERRYQSAAELAQDLRRYLAGEAILARPPSVLYQLRVFARRHTAALSAVIAIFVVLTGGLIVSGALYARADRARVVAARERDRARAAEKSAERRRAEAEAVTQFLSETLASVDPHEAMGAEVTVKEMLDRAAEGIGAAFTDQPLVEATLRATIGNTYRALGKYAAAEPHLRAALEIRRRALGEDHPEVAACLNDLGWLLRKKGDLTVAERLYREALGIRRGSLGEEHPDVAASLNNLANLLAEQGDYSGAEPLHREALALRRKCFGQEHRDVAESLNNLASLLHNKGDYLAAEPLYREALAMRRRLLGSEDPRVTTTLNNLALLLKDMGDYAGAEPLLREALVLRRKVLGDQHPDVATSLNNLALVLKMQGDFTAAEPLYREALAIRRESLGDEHPRVAVVLQNLAGVLRSTGDYAGAEPLYRQGLAIARQAYGAKHPHVATALNNLAGLLKVKGEYAAAEALYREALAIRRELLGHEHPAVADVLGNLGSMLVARGDAAAAEPLLREAVAINRKSRPDNDTRAALTEGFLGSCLTVLRRFEEAEPLLLESYETIASVQGTRHESACEAVQRLSVLYESWGRQAEAAQWRAKLPTSRPVSEAIQQEP